MCKHSVASPLLIFGIKTQRQSDQARDVLAFLDSLLPRHKNAQGILRFKISLPLQLQFFCSLENTRYTAALLSHHIVPHIPHGHRPSPPTTCIYVSIYMCVYKMFSFRDATACTTVPCRAFYFGVSRNVHGNATHLPCCVQKYETTKLRRTTYYCTPATFKSGLMIQILHSYLSATRYEQQWAPQESATSMNTGTYRYLDHAWEKPRFPIPIDQSMCFSRRTGNIYLKTT